MKFAGLVTADIIETRFSFSGKVVYVKKSEGDPVKSGEVIASLDRKPLQIDLDHQLSDYEKVRAESDLFDKNPPGDGDTAKFLRTGKQSTLNASVKDVEQAKYKLDQADLISPIAGIITDLGGLVNGINVTPSSNPVKILDSHSTNIKFEIDQKDIPKFLSSVKLKIKVNGIKEKFEGISEVPYLGNKGKFVISVKPTETQKLIPGMICEVTD